MLVSMFKMWTIKVNYSIFIFILMFACACKNGYFDFPSLAIGSDYDCLDATFRYESMNLACCKPLWGIKAAMLHTSILTYCSPASGRDPLSVVIVVLVAAACTIEKSCAVGLVNSSEFILRSESLMDLGKHVPLSEQKLKQKEKLELHGLACFLWSHATF